MGTFTWTHAIRGEHDIHTEDQTRGIPQGIRAQNALSSVTASRDFFKTGADGVTKGTRRG